MYVDFLHSSLLPRQGQVTVEDAVSEAFTLCDMVFQGTVLGTCLWNIFFDDVIVDVPTGSQDIELFADDLVVAVHTPQESSNDMVLDTLATVQHRIDLWGKRKQVAFDPGKEHFKILHPGLTKNDQ